MKNIQKGFTLVELIVVITILAILGTIAFISLQGHSQDAKNSKVASDIRSLGTSVETKLTNGSVTLGTLVSGDLSSTNAVTGTFGGATSTLGTDGTYNVGTLNFVGLKQNGEDFKDNSGNDYIAAVAVDGSDKAYYQIVGQTSNPDGSYTAVIKGNYFAADASDVAGLVSASTDTTPLTNNAIHKDGLY